MTRTHLPSSTQNIIIWEPMSIVALCPVVLSRLFHRLFAVEEPFGVFLKAPLESCQDGISSENNKESADDSPTPFSVLRILFLRFFNLFLAQFNFPVSDR